VKRLSPVKVPRLKKAEVKDIITYSWSLTAQSEQPLVPRPDPDLLVQDDNVAVWFHIASEAGDNWLRANFGNHPYYCQAAVFVSRREAGSVKARAHAAGLVLGSYEEFMAS
jgi:hypothetical protein